MITLRGKSIKINGKRYESITSASRDVGLSTITIKKRCLSSEYLGFAFVEYIMSDKKKCNLCGEVKLLPEFDKCEGGKYGVKGRCKDCRTIYLKKYCKEHLIEQAAIVRNWRKNNIDRARETARKSARKRRENLSYRLHNNFSRRMRETINNSKDYQSWVSLVDYNLEKLKQHLETQFKDGMSWGNYGIGEDKWNIDHILPISHFDIDSYDCQDFKNCWALDNLQPLWHIENMAKGYNLNWRGAA